MPRIVFERVAAMVEVVDLLPSMKVVFVWKICSALHSPLAVELIRQRRRAALLCTEKEELRHQLAIDAEDVCTGELCAQSQYETPQQQPSAAHGLQDATRPVSPVQHHSQQY